MWGYSAKYGNTTSVPLGPRHIVVSAQLHRRAKDRATARFSKIRLVGLRNRCHLVIEKVQIVLGTDHFRHGSVSYASPALDRRPWHVEGVGVIDSYDRLQRPAAL